MERKQITIGLFGFGCVGKGLWDVLEKTPGLRATIRSICVKNPGKPRPISPDHFTFEKNDILNDPEINTVVELIDDADAAFEIVRRAMLNGKGVVSANKKMIAEHFDELLSLQKECNVPFLYEAACCASIPIIRNLEEYYDNDLLVSLEGIVNGSTNYILTRTAKDGISYDEALKLAQQLGYAESNPKLDVEGYDSKYKLTILLAHAFGIVEEPGHIFNLGIDRLNSLELKLAAEKGYKVRLIAKAHKLTDDKVASFVMPQFVDEHNRFFTVDDVFNGVQTETSFSDKQFFMGKGAGAFPTASAVLSDISALSYDYRYEYKKMQQQDLCLSTDFSLDVFVRFNDDVSIHMNEFIKVNEQYRSEAGNYIVGKINFNNLISSSWINSPKVSVLLTANSQIESMQPAGVR
jgi:homoserine dehydrogenase